MFFIENNIGRALENSDSQIEVIGSRVSQCAMIQGCVKSCEPIVIDGSIDGTISCDDLVIVNKNAYVNGTIYAKEVRVYGVVDGPIEAEVVVISATGKHTGYIVAINIVIDGVNDGDILARERLLINKDAKVIAVDINTQIVTVYGDISGVIRASEIVDLKKSGVINGDIYTDNFQAHSSGVIWGLVQRYCN